MKKKFVILLTVMSIGFVGCAPVSTATQPTVQLPTQEQLQEEMYKQEITQDYLNFLHKAKTIMHVKRGDKYGKR